MTTSRRRLDEWAREQDLKPYLRFSTAGSRGADPGELTEAVGDEDAVASTTRARSSGANWKTLEPGPTGAPGISALRRRT